MQGNLFKMSAEGTNPVQYRLRVGEQLVEMNSLLGERLALQYLGRINCIKCGRETRTSFFQGFCYPCYLAAPEAEECVLNPEKCRAHEGLARDMDYAREHCLIPHVVYLAESGGIKVGVTRITQVPTRWIDQGASQAIELARTPNRFLAGELEVALKNVLADKTNWRRMLTATGDGLTDMRAFRDQVMNDVPDRFRGYLMNESVPQGIRYPVLEYPKKVSSVNLEKDGGIDAVLIGIRGQYLLFEGGRVLNIRKYGGYFVDLTSATLSA